MYINHCIWHINVPKLLHMTHQCTKIIANGTPVYQSYCTWHIDVPKLLCVAHQCTQITACGTPAYPNYCTWYINVPKLLHMAHQCTQITANGTSMYPSYCMWYINVSKSGTLFLPMLKYHRGICDIILCLNKDKNVSEAELFPSSGKSTGYH